MFKDTSNILLNIFSQRFLTDTKYEVDIAAWETALTKLIAQTFDYRKKAHVLYEVHAPNKLGYWISPIELAEMKKVVDKLFSDSEIKFIYHV